METKVRKVLLTTLSKKPNNIRENHYYCKEGNQVIMCSGFQQQVPGTKYFLSTEEIDQIIILGSDAVFQPSEKLEEIISEIEGEITDDETTLSYYKKHIAKFIKEGEEGIEKSLYENVFDDVELQYMKVNPANYRVNALFIPLHKDGKDNLVEITDAIRGEGNAKVKLYIDMQGGSRTDGYVRNAVIEMLSNEVGGNIEVAKIIATKFDETQPMQEIVNETKRYQISDLVSGMNAFVNYGKADLIKQYIEKVGIENETIKKMVYDMEGVDDALNLCSHKLFARKIEGLRNTLLDDKFDDDNEFASTEEVIFKVLKDGIERGYGELLKEKETHILTYVKWLVDKHMWQQALTFIEARAPYDFAKDGLFYCCTSENREEIKGKIRDYWDDSNTKIEDKKEISQDFEHYFFNEYYKNNSNIRNFLGDDVNPTNEIRNRLKNRYKEVKNKRNDVSHMLFTEEQRVVDEAQQCIMEFYFAYIDAMQQNDNNSQTRFIVNIESNWNYSFITKIDAKPEESTYDPREHGYERVNVSLDKLTTIQDKGIIEASMDDGKDYIISSAYTDMIDNENFNLIKGERIDGRRIFGWSGKETTIYPIDKIKNRLDRKKREQEEQRKREQEQKERELEEWMRESQQQSAQSMEALKERNISNQTAGGSKHEKGAPIEVTIVGKKEKGKGFNLKCEAEDGTACTIPKTKTTEITPDEADLLRGKKIMATIDVIDNGVPKLSPNSPLRDLLEGDSENE